jgi:hypothetical protein
MTGLNSRSDPLNALRCAPPAHDWTHMRRVRSLHFTKVWLCAKTTSRGPCTLGLGPVKHDRTLCLGPIILVVPCRLCATQQHNRTLKTGLDLTSPPGPVITVRPRPQHNTDRTQAGQGPVLAEPGLGPRPVGPFLFLSPQLLHPCFQVANHNVYNSCAHELSFFKIFYKGQG